MRLTRWSCRVCRERPSRRGATKQRDELAPLHVFPREDHGLSMP